MPEVIASIRLVCFLDAVLAWRRHTTSILDPIVPCAGVATGVVLVRDNDVIPGLDGLPHLGSVWTSQSWRPPTP